MTRRRSEMAGTFSVSAVRAGFRDAAHLAARGRGELEKLAISAAAVLPAGQPQDEVTVTIEFSDLPRVTAHVVAVARPARVVQDAAPASPENPAALRAAARHGDEAAAA